MRPGYSNLPTNEWTEAEALHHLSGTFDAACREFPDIMEPYVVQLADGVKENQKDLMRRGLRETIRKRFPLASDNPQ